MSANSPAKPESTGAVPLLDIAGENAPLLDAMQRSVGEVLRTGRFVFGPDCGQFEQEFAALCRVKHAVGCASGSDALLLALMALDVGRGDEVIVPSFTFFATASAAWRLGATPVFVDIEPGTFNVNVARVAAAVTPQTKAIIPVHLFGQCAEMGALGELAARHGIAIVEDAAQAVAAQYRGQMAGAIGQFGCFSFYPTKNLGGCGDGGLVTTNDDALAAKLKKLRNHGMEPRYYHEFVGMNSRLDTMQAAALRVKLPHLPAWTAARRANAARYTELFAAAGLDDAIGLPRETPGCHHVWNQYTIRVPGGRRDALRQHLAAQQIGSEIYYPVPLHRQQCFQSLSYATGPLPETDRAAAEVLSLPIFPGITQSQQSRVVESIAAFLAQSQRVAA